MTDSHSIAAIVLAAGQSKRMGQTNKLLTEINSKTLLQHVLTNLKKSAINDVVVVTGYQTEQVNESIAQFVVVSIENDQYASGLSSSIKVGVENLAENTDAVLVCQADMPFISPNTVNKILDAFIHQEQIIIPTYKGQKGNPLLWPQKHFNKLTKLSGDCGARQILKNYQDEVSQLDVDDIGILLDIDDEAALEFMRSKFNNNQEKHNAN